jgi:hypothetical protein
MPPPARGCPHEVRAGVFVISGCSFIDIIYLIRLRNSLRVRSSLRKMPLKADVVVTAFAFWTPLKVMHVCDASMTTATPRG